MELLFISLAAFLGGLALNIMPCVLPVVSIKLWHLVEMADKSHNSIRKEIAAYVIGLITTFIVLGFIVLLFQQLGYFLCWGFQFQSPWFVLAMAILMFAVGLNLMGVFDAGIAFGSQIAQWDWYFRSGKHHLVASFISGVFTTLIATPCSGPLLATAIGYSLGAGPLVATLIFLLSGIGTAFPFIIIMFFPKLIKFVPRPGEWMNYFRTFLGYCAIISSGWLGWLFYNLIS